MQTSYLETPELSPQFECWGLGLGGRRGRGEGGERDCGWKNRNKNGRGERGELGMRRMFMKPVIKYPKYHENPGLNRVFALPGIIHGLFTY